MEDIKFYHKGVRVFEKNLISKILKDSTLCRWHDSDDMIDENFTGYKKNNEYYDICSFLSKKYFKNLRLKEEEYIIEFKNIKDKILGVIEIINKFILSLDEITKIKNNQKNLSHKIELGYELIQFRITGGKKNRRFKKDNKKYFTEKEIDDLKKQLEELSKREIFLCKKIKLEQLLREVIKETQDITIEKMYRYNNRFEWHETVGLFKEYQDYLEKLKKKVNLFTFNDMKDNYLKLGKHLDKELEDITLFEDTFEKITIELKEDIEYYEKTKIKEKREVTKKAKFYLDENGNRIRLENNVEQIVVYK